MAHLAGGAGASMLGIWPAATTFYDHPSSALLQSERKRPASWLIPIWRFRIGVAALW